MDDAALDAAKEEALAKIEQQEDAVEDAPEEDVIEDEIEENVEEEVEEDIDEGLPTDHKERSNLGRKVAAVFDKTDRMEEILVRQQEMIELLGGKNAPTEYEEEEDSTPLTRGDLRKIQTEKTQKAAKYETDFKSTFHDLAKEAGLSEDEKEEVGGILLANYNLKTSDNGILDGSKAFQRAYREYSGKKTPLQKRKVSGVAKKQKSKAQERPLKKLDRATESYLASIKRDRGAEVALRLRKGL